jgi:hypothetical protein
VKTDLVRYLHARRVAIASCFGAGRKKEKAHSMAESIVSLVAKSLGNLVIEEATFLKGVSQQIKQIEIELKRMQCFLKEADKRQNEDESIQN